MALPKSKGLTNLNDVLMGFMDPASMTREQSEMLIQLIDEAYLDAGEVFTSLHVLDRCRYLHLANLDRLNKQDPTSKLLDLVVDEVEAA